MTTIDDIRQRLEQQHFENYVHDRDSADFEAHAYDDMRALLDALDAANARLEAVESLWRDYLHAEKHNLYHQTLNAVDRARQYFEEHHAVDDNL